MDLLLLLVIPASALASAAGAYFAVMQATARLKRQPLEVEEPVIAFDPEGKHRHNFDRTIAARKGYFCACGERMPDIRQPRPWRETY